MIPVTTTTRVITGPTVEPVSLDLMKQHLRVYWDFEDSLILSYITTARMQVEQYLGRALMSQTLLSTYKLSPHYRPYIVGDPLWGWGGTGTGLTTGLRYDGAVQFPRSPVQSLSTVTLRDHAGTDWVVVNNPPDQIVYNVDLELDPGKFRLLFREVLEWYPALCLPLEHIQLEFIAGYDGSEYDEAIPQPIINAILLLTGYLYERRGTDMETPSVPHAVYVLCDPYRLVNFGGQ